MMRHVKLALMIWLASSCRRARSSPAWSAKRAVRQARPRSRRDRSGLSRRSRRESVSSRSVACARTGACRAAGGVASWTPSRGGTRHSSCGRRASPKVTVSSTSRTPAPRRSSSSTGRGTRNSASPGSGTRSLVSPVAVTPGPAGHGVCRGQPVATGAATRSGRRTCCARSRERWRLQRPSSLAFDAVRHRLYVGDSKAHVVHVFDEHGDEGRLHRRAWRRPGRIQFADASRLDAGRQCRGHRRPQLSRRSVRCRTVSSSTELGELGDGAGNFAAPKGVAVDRDGHIYAADAMFDAVQVFDADGQPDARLR